MIIARIRTLALAVVASFAAMNGARSADMPLAPPPPDPSGWYLRGDIGFTNQSVNSLFNTNYSGFLSVSNIDKGFDAAPLFGLGIGYTINNWLRVDVTGEYRGKANFHALDVGALPGGGFASDRYVGSKSEWLVLLNGYVDLGTWWNITPFIGAGVGMSRNTISNFGDFSICINSSGLRQWGSDAYANSASKWNFAWALHAGLAYQIWRNATIELSYRYVDLGDARSGDLIRVRWNQQFLQPDGIQSPDLARRQAGHAVPAWCSDYAPPPPPLRSKG